MNFFIITSRPKVSASFFRVRALSVRGGQDRYLLPPDKLTLDYNPCPCQSMLNSYVNVTGLEIGIRVRLWYNAKYNRCLVAVR